MAGEVVTGVMITFDVAVVGTIDVVVASFVVTFLGRVEVDNVVAGNAVAGVVTVDVTGGVVEVVVTVIEAVAILAFFVPDIAVAVEVLVELEGFCGPLVYFRTFSCLNP